MLVFKATFVDALAYADFAFSAWAFVAVRFLEDAVLLVHIANEKQQEAMAGLASDSCNISIGSPIMMIILHRIIDDSSAIRQCIGYRGTSRRAEGKRPLAWQIPDYKGCAAIHPHAPYNAFVRDNNKCD